VIDVLVAGAGPTGLLLAAELRRRGLSIRIIDRAPGPHRCCKATSVQLCTMALFEQLGLGAELRAQSLPIERANFYPWNAPAWQTPLQLLGYGCPQYELEGILRASLGPEHIEWGVELRGLEQLPESVRVGLSSGSQDARFVVGCDGAHSTVRHLAGIPFEGVGYPSTFVLADVEMEGDLSPGEQHFFLGEHSVSVALPIPGRRRFALAILDPRGRVETDHGLDASHPPSLEEAHRLLEFTGRDLRLSEPRYLGHYRVSRRLAQRWREGRVLLAGDAAHIQSPSGGLGMNLGVHDSVNLAWKLAEVVHGEAPESLLDSYGDERRPIAEEMGALSEIIFLEQTEHKPRPVDMPGIVLRPHYEMLEGRLRQQESLSKGFKHPG